MTTKTKTKQADWLTVRKVDGGFIVIEEFDSEDASNIPHVCQTIDHVFALMDNLLKEQK